MRLGAALYGGPSGPLLLDLSRARGVRFSTNERGFASFSCTVPLSLVDAYYIYDRAGLPHIAVTWAGGVVWEGRLEDVSIVPGGVRLGALGYIRGYADAPYSTAHIGVTALTIVQALVAAASTLNSFMSASTMLLQDPGVTLAEIYEDRYPVEILERLCNLGDNQTTPRLWEAGVWERRILHFRPRGHVARKWAVDIAAPEIERTLDTLYNSVYAVYQDGGNQRAVTATSADATSVARYGLTRRAGVNLQAIDATLAGKVRDAYLADHKDPPVRAAVEFGRLYDMFGTLWPAYMARSGDQLTLRNLPPTASADIDRIRTFRLKETDYDADADLMTVVPEALNAGLSPEGNAERIASVTDPNLQYQPRPTLAELIADFQGLPKLRGLWPLASITETPTAIDASGQGRTLTFNGTTTLGVHGGFLPYLDFDGTTGYLSRADEAGLDIVGTLTLGGYFWVDSGAGIGSLIAKYSTVAAQRSFFLRYTGSNAFQFGVGDGVTDTTVTSSVVVEVNRWYYVVGRFSPSAEVTIFVNEAKTANVTSIPGAIVASTAAFEIGRLNATNGQYLDGRAAVPWLSATTLTDEQINHLFSRTRKFFST